jgi:hypothetical protein
MLYTILHASPPTSRQGGEHPQHGKDIARAGKIQLLLSQRSKSNLLELHTRLLRVLPSESVLSKGSLTTRTRHWTFGTRSRYSGTLPYSNLNEITWCPIAKNERKAPLKLHTTNHSIFAFEGEKPSCVTVRLGRKSSWISCAESVFLTIWVQPMMLVIQGPEKESDKTKFHRDGDVD